MIEEQWILRTCDMIKVYVLEPRDQGMIQFGFIGNHKGTIIRYGTKGNVYIPFISNVFLVENNNS